MTSSISKITVFDNNNDAILCLISLGGDNSFKGMGKELQEFLIKNKKALGMSKLVQCPEDFEDGMEALASDLFIHLHKKFKNVLPIYRNASVERDFEYHISFDKDAGLLLKGRALNGEDSGSWLSIHYAWMV